MHLPELQLPPGHSELKLHLPSGAVEHLPLLHLAPLPPQSESNEQLEPAESAHLPLEHFTPEWQSELKLHLPYSPATAESAKRPSARMATTASILRIDMVPPP
ncbi:MAG TPA: hypothetical protein P5076_12010 [Myxococcota bacterium]|nr:hypothetical protein [Myxococcota bacterium]